MVREARSRQTRRSIPLIGATKYLGAVLVLFAVLSVATAEQIHADYPGPLETNETTDDHGVRSCMAGFGLVGVDLRTREFQCRRTVPTDREQHIRTIVVRDHRRGNRDTYGCRQGAFLRGLDLERRTPERNHLCGYDSRVGGYGADPGRGPIGPHPESYQEQLAPGETVARCRDTYYLTSISPGERRFSCGRVGPWYDPK